MRLKLAKKLQGEIQVMPAVARDHYSDPQRMDIVNSIRSALPNSPQELGRRIDEVDMSPTFICVHYCLVALSLRSQVGAYDYSHQHPFPSWFVCVTSCFGGNVVANFLLGKPIIAVYLNSNNLLLASLVWYLVFFSPLDIFNKLCKITGFKAILLILKEVHRIRSIKDGVAAAWSLYSGNYFVAILIGSVKGSGAKFLMRPLYQFTRGNIQAQNEFLQPSFSTKHAVVTSVFLLLQKDGVIDVDKSLLISIIVVVAASVQVMLLLGWIEDPYKRIEAFLCKGLLQLPNEFASKKKKTKAD